DPAGVYITGLLGVEIDLARLRGRLFPPMLSNLESGNPVALAIVREQQGDYVIGAELAAQQPMALQTLAPPFDLWRVAVTPRDVNQMMRWMDFRATVWTWLVSLLLLSILAGAYVFLRRAQRQAYIARAQA